MDLREIGLGGVDWIRLSQDRDRWRAVVSAVMNLRVLAPRSQLVYTYYILPLEAQARLNGKNSIRTSKRTSHFTSIKNLVNSLLSIVYYRTLWSSD
jgi:uncharacterized protein YcaQ